MTLLALAAAEELAPLWLPNWAFPLIAVVGFVTLALITWSFRDVANRHSEKVERAERARGTGQH
jgi:hypothetical protein